jgi:(p)ppGpp synthase/HD superfamily hydrolase
MDRPGAHFSLNLERALRWAAVCHRHQVRKGSDTPYVTHVMGVALVLDRLGFAEEVVIAGLLHDVVEDTPATLDEVEAGFGPAVAEIVRHCSEIKTDATGHKRPWIDRKRDQLEALQQAPVEARAVVLADKLHNLVSIELDLREGREVWSRFNADRSQFLDYYKRALEQLGNDDDRLRELAYRGLQTLEAIEAFESRKTGEDSRVNR